MQRTTISATVDRPSPPPGAPAASPPTVRRGRVGCVVVATMLGGLVAAIVCVAGPFAGAQEHVITGTVLISFALSWAALAFATELFTDQPQRWAKVPAAAMAAAGAAVIVAAPTGNPAGWVWPPALLTLVAWMVVRVRRALRSRTRVFVLYPVFAVLALAAIGGGYETYREGSDPAAAAMPGRLVDVGGHKLHIDCTGSGTPTVVLEAGLGEMSTIMSSRIGPSVARTTRVCVYDRAGRGWSEPAGHAQDGTGVATDLHTLLRNAGEPGPYVLAGHSAGGIYVLNFARLFPDDVAGLALLDSMHPEQYERMKSWPAFYETYRRASAVMPALARLGVGRLVYSGAYGDLPSPQRAQEEAFLATPRHNRSVRDEFSQIRTAMRQAAGLQSIGDTPLVVVTATRGADVDWPAMQHDLTTLSTNVEQRLVPDATHAMIVEDKAAAEHASRAIVDVVTAARTHRPLGTETFEGLVRIDNGQLHLRCTGKGPTTVLLIAGWMKGDDGWGAVEPALSKQARVCSYARFGTGASDKPRSTQTFSTQVADLHEMLDRAGETGPYVVVGHSFGGAEAVMFASTHRDEMAGLMLIDASPVNWPATVCSVPAYADGCAIMRDPTLDPERLDVFPAFAEVAQVASLGRLPMTVITAAHRNPASLTAAEVTRLEAEWSAGMERWAALSSSSRIVPVADTGHDIHIDRPQVVVDELLKLVP